MGDTFKVIAPIFSWIMDAMAPEAPVDQGSESQGVKVNTKSTDAPINIVYGKRAVGGNDIFMTTAGSNNKYLWIVTTLSEGECEGIATVDGADQIWLDGLLEEEYGSYVSYTFSAGTSAATVDAGLSTDYPSWTDTLRHTCNIIFKLEWDEDRESGRYNFQGVPERLVELKGKKIVDFRNSPTSAAEWTQNPVLCLYDFMTNTRYGMGMEASKFDLTSWTAAANYCDTKNFTLNMIVAGDTKSGDVIAEILTHFRGNLIWFDNKFYCRYADLNYESAVLHIRDDDILVDEGGNPAINMAQPGRFSKPQMLEVEFIDEEKGYTDDVISIGESEEKPEKLTLKGCTDRTMASNLGVYHLERQRLDRTISGTFRDHLVVVDPYDVVYLTCDALTIEDQIMRVTDTSIGSDGLVNLSLQFESYDLYDDDYDVDITEVYQSTLPDPNDEPPGVSNVQYEEELRFHRERTYTDLSITFDQPVDYPWFDHVEVWISTTTDATSAYKHQYNVVTDFKIENIEEGSGIWIVLRVRNIWGAKQSFNNGYKIATLILGKTAAPQSLDSLAVIPNDNNVNLYADPVTDPDVEAYEFRLGDSWSAAVFLAANRRPVYSLTGVKPGTHTFWCNTLGTNGVYGATPRSGSVTISPGSPPSVRGWTYEQTITPDWTTPLGTFTNTEIVTYSGDDYLKVTHTPAVTGTYLSEVFDAGLVGTRYVWVDTEFVIIGEGTQWNSKFTGTPGVSGTTWAQGGGLTKSWAEIFELTEAPRVNIWVYADDSSPPTEVLRKRMEILSAVIGGDYIQVYIAITDPSSEVYAYVKDYTIYTYT